MHIFGGSKMTIDYSSIFGRRVKNVHDASSKYATMFQCYFGHVMQIFDASKMTFTTTPPESLKNLYIPQYSGRVLSKLGDTLNFTLKYSSTFRRCVNSSRLRVKNAIMTQMAYHIIYRLFANCSMISIYFIVGGN